MLNSIKKKAAFIMAFAVLAGTAPVLYGGESVISDGGIIYAAATEDTEDPLDPYVDGFLFTNDGIKSVLIGVRDKEGEVVIPSEDSDLPVQVIGQCTFQRKTGITKVVVPDSVKFIESNAFDICTDLEAVDLPDSVISMEKCVFSNCSSLLEVKMPEGMTSVPESCFSNCRKLKSVVLSSNTKNIYTYAFQQCRALESIEFPDTLERIYGASFSDCYALEEVNIPDSVYMIDMYAFAECSGLKKIKLPAKLTAIKARTFYHCSSLESIEIPETVTTVEENAFYGCENLKSVTIPPSVTQIGKMAFGYTVGEGAAQFGLIDGFSIKGQVGSAAQEYANMHMIPFYDMETGELVSAPTIIKGDVDSDGSVTASDLASMIQILLGKVELTEDITASADMDDNGIVNILDLIKLKNLFIQ
ncbi:MAG: leucine-rich repeat protein [Oscillospiraceae bacterium]|nr:leucine-rich repeat protein [Oscillospiraceae bacterium]